MLCRTSAYVLGLWWVWVRGRGRLRGERLAGGVSSKVGVGLMAI